ncbi:MAG: response regulator [Bacteroidetes bacterium]|nr:response regulator [Bacteroidota bacterium]
MEKFNIISPILLVEDNPMDVDMTLEAFSESKLANPIQVCRDGEEAIEFINNHRDPASSDFPCLVLLDLRLPKIDGLDVLKKIKTDEEWFKTPVIILTTSSQNEDIDEAYKLGANSYLIKPVDTDDFKEIIKNIRLFWILTNQAPVKKL